MLEVKMSKNLKVAKQFIDEHYYTRTAELKHLISPEFEYSVNSGAPFGFKEYVERRSLYSKNAKLDFEEFRSNDDIHFHANFKAILKGDQDIDGKLLMTVDKGLLMRMEIDYDLTIYYDLSDDEIKVLEKSLLKK